MWWLLLLIVAILLLRAIVRAISAHAQPQTSTLREHTSQAQQTSTIHKWRSLTPCREPSFTWTQLEAECRSSSLKISERCRTKIRGVTFENRDGTPREAIIVSKCHPDDMLGLAREPTNRHDRNAIQVMRLVWTGKKTVSSAEQLGFISRELAVDLAPEIDAGITYIARITSLTGGGELTTGVNIQILRVDTPVEKV